MMLKRTDLVQRLSQLRPAPDDDNAEALNCELDSLLADMSTPPAPLDLDDDDLSSADLMLSRNAVVAEQLTVLLRVCRLAGNLAEAFRHSAERHRHASIEADNNLARVESKVGRQLEKAGLGAQDNPRYRYAPEAHERQFKFTVRQSAEYRNAVDELKNHRAQQDAAREQAKLATELASTVRDHLRMLSTDPYARAIA